MPATACRFKPGLRYHDSIYPGVIDTATSYPANNPPGHRVGVVDSESASLASQNAPLLLIEFLLGDNALVQKLL